MPRWPARRPARALAAQTGDEITVVFERKPNPPLSSPVIEVAHAPRPGPNSADDEIVRRVRADRGPELDPGRRPPTICWATASRELGARRWSRRPRFATGSTSAGSRHAVEVLMASRVYVIELGPRRVAAATRGSLGLRRLQRPRPRDPFRSASARLQVVGLVKRFALRLRPDLYDDLGPFRGSAAGRRGGAARARELAALRLRRPQRRDVVRQGRWRLDEWDGGGSPAVGGHVDAAAARADRVGVRAADRRPLRPAAARRARLLGRRLHRSRMIRRPATGCSHTCSLRRSKPG